MEHRRIWKHPEGTRNTPDKDETNTIENHKGRKKQRAGRTGGTSAK